MAATAKDFPNTSYMNVSEPVSSAAGPGKVGFSGSSVGSLNIGSLDNLTRLAGSLGSLFGGSSSINDIIAASTKALKEAQRQTNRKINRRIENIYPELTGMTGEEALNKYYEAFGDTVQNVTSQGRSDLLGDYDIGKQYGELSNRISGIQAGPLNLANLVGGYEKLALDPPVVSMNVGSIRDVADWVDPTTNQIKNQYKALYDYSDPQTQQFLYGARNTADAIGRYYNTSGDVGGLMSYGTLS